MVENASGMRKITNNKKGISCAKLELSVYAMDFLRLSYITRPVLLIQTLFLNTTRTFFNTLYDARKVVIQQNQIGSIAGHVRPYPKKKKKSLD